jgi:hypothetical protein
VTDDDDVSDEGAALPNNPALREVVQAAPTDRTAMIDLEAVEAKRAARRVQRAAAEAAEAEAEAGGNADETTPPPTSVPGRDPDATGTLARKKKRSRTEASRLVRDEQSRTNRGPADDPRTAADVDATAEDADRDVDVDADADADAPRERTRAREGTEQLKRRAAANKKKKAALSPAAAASVVVIAVVALIAAVFVGVRATAVLTITTVPHGAQVTLDGEPVGTSPLQKRVRTGSHVIELALDGYEPFREVVDVPSAGLPFLQPMKALPPPPPPPPTPAEIAADLAGQAKRLFEAGDLDGALGKVDEIEKLVPDHAASQDIRVAIKQAAAKREGDRKRDQGIAAREAQLKKARQLADEGKRAYEAGKLGPARTALYESLKIDGSNPDPHRTLAKIFNRENEVEKVRYHLERFLALGGNDADFKVREWLKSHPK